MSEEILRREFQLDFTPTGDGRTLDVRIVPYNSPAKVRDGNGPWYTEEWAPGVFRNKENKPNDVLVNVEHEQGFAAKVARCIGFSDGRNGFDGTFRMLSDSASDKALELVNEGVFTGVSLEAIPLESQRTADGVVRRISAKLVGLALCRNPAFPDARVMAVREAPEPEPDDPDPDPDPEPDPEPESEPVPAYRSEVDEMLARVGYESMIRRAVVRTKWDGSASRFTDEEWTRSTILDRGNQFDTPKTRYALPVLEPNGDLNVNAMHAAGAALMGGRGGVNASPAAKAAAMRKLRRYYGQAGENMPPQMIAMAGRA